MVSKDRIFRIGTSEVCEIVVAGGEPANAIWVQLTVSESSMHLLTVVAPGISCSVNGNVVSKQYWVHSNDRIEIAGYILNWAYINGDSNEPFINQPKKSSSRSMKMWIFILIGALALGAAFMFLKGGVSAGVKRKDGPKNENDTTHVDTIEVGTPILEPIEDPVPETADREDIVLEKPAIKQKTTPAEQNKKNHVVEQEVAADVNEPVVESPASDDPDESTEKPIAKPKIEVSDSTPVDKLWEVLKENDKNCLALYYLALKYQKRVQQPIKSPDDEDAINFWNSHREEVIYYTGKFKSAAVPKLVFVMLAMAYNNRPADIDPSILADIQNRLDTIKKENTDYKY